MEYHPAVAQIRKLLDDNSVEYKFFEHEAVRTSEEASALRPDYTLSQGAKAIITRAKQRDGTYRFIMFVFPADRKFDGKKAKQLVDVKGISFASAEEATEITKGVEFGGVPPFGNIFNLPVIVDNSLLVNQEIIFNCGDRRCSIAMKIADYLTLVPHQLGGVT